MNVSEIAEEILGGKGYFVLHGLMSVADAAAARSIALAEASAAGIVGNSARNQKIKHGSARRLLDRGELFERMVQEPTIVGIAETLLGDDMTLSSYACRVLWPGATEMGVHVDYPYWAMSGPYAVRPALMLQVIWMLQDFTEDNGATLVLPGSQLFAMQPDAERFRREAIKLTGPSGTAIVSHGLLWHDTAQNRTEEPRVSMLINYGSKVIRPLESDIGEVPPEVLERATPKLRQLLGLDFGKSLSRDLERRKLY